MKSKRQHSKTFANIVSEVENAPPIAFEVWPAPIGDREWYDETGSHWHMRGHLLDVKEMRRLLKRPDVRVVLFYDVPSEVSGSAQDELVARIEEFFKGGAPPYRGFRLADFRDDHGGVMLVVEESC